MEIKLASRLKPWLQESGLTLDQLAEKAGTSRTTCHNYINGRMGTPRLETLTRIVEALGHTMAELYEGIDEPPADETELALALANDKIQKMEEAEREMKHTIERMTDKMEAAVISFNATVRRERIEKYALFVLVLLLISYGLYCFFVFDIQDPTRGLWQQP